MSKEDILKPPYDFFKRGYTTAGLAYAILQNHSGALCGYVRVPRKHPLWKVIQARRFDFMYPTISKKKTTFRRGYRHPAIERLDVHGGVTFAGRPNRTCRGVWIGFDCAHCDDFVPGLPEELQRIWGATAFRTPEYVRAECERLARQIKDYPVTQ